MTEWFQDFFQQVIDLAGAHPSWVGLLIFLFSVSEGLAIIGATLPGETVLVGIIAVAAAGGGDIWMMFFWASFGATAGDGLSFWMGRKYGQTILKWPGFRSNPGLLERGRLFIQEHGAKSIAIARFIPVIRSIVPLAAGIFHMNPVRFYVANVLSAIVWAAVHVFPAAALGLAYRTVGEVSGRLAAALLALLLLMAFAIWLVRLVILRALPHAASAYRHFINWLQDRPGPLWRYLAHLLHPDRPGFAGLVFWGLAIALTASGIISILDSLTGVSALTRADMAITHLLQRLRSDPVDAFMVLITAFGDLLPLLSATLIMALVLLAYRAWRLAMAAVAFIAAGAVVVPFVQTVLHLSPPIVPNPDNGLLAHVSSHVAMTVSLFGILAVLVSRKLPPGGKVAIFSMVVLWTGLIAASRLWLSAQWPSVVLGAMLAGMLLTALFGLFFTQVKIRPYSRSLLGGLVLVTYLISGSLHARHVFPASLMHYAPQIKVRVMPLRIWLESGWRSLPARRIDLGGAQKERLFLQWAGHGQLIPRILASAGWRKARDFTWLDAINLVSPNARLENIPPLPVLHDGRLPALTVTRALQNPDTRLVLRFWRSDAAVQTKMGERPVLLAAAAMERLEWPFSWMALMREEPAPPAVEKNVIALLRQSPALNIQQPAPKAPMLVWSKPPASGAN